MTFTDLLIVYLAFGAPLAVYKYLQNRTAHRFRRILVSSLTFAFWVPAAVEIGYLYLTNANFSSGFVSQRDLDADTKLSLMRESVSTEVIKLSRNSNPHDLRETVDRYVGLADAARNSSAQRAIDGGLFRAAGRKNDELGSICLMRRNLRRLERHHIQASADFVDLFEHLLDRPNISVPLEKGIELARQLDDDKTVLKLRVLRPKKGEVWNSELPQQQHQTRPAVPAIPVTASLNSD
jgi:hypothetical protein